VSQRSDDALTGPIRGQAGLAGAQAHPGAPRAIGDPVLRWNRWNTARDLTAAVLLVAALFLPWNLYFGVGIPDSRTPLFALLGAVTLLSLVAIAVTHVGPWQAAGAGRLRVLLNVPYQLLVIAFIVFDVFQTIRSGGSVHVPGGVGPGAWLGAAGSLLAAQPMFAGSDAELAADGDRFDKWRRSGQIVGYASMVGASLSTAFNLYWRVWYALHGAGGSAGSSGFGKQNIAVIATAVVYGAVALAAVLVASRWLLRSTKASQLATIALGVSTLVAGILVWDLPVGRDIDAFHGIAQNTSTAGVGYEGYLAWSAGAAIFAPRTLLGYRDEPPDDDSRWRGAARKGLLLIAVWCLGSVLMRITDLAVTATLNYPYSRYDTMTLAAFDLATGVLAIWLRVNLTNESVSTRLTSSLCGLLVALGISRVVVGVILAPRFQEPPNGGGWSNPVYGNNLAQQITSTFDVALCGLALGIFAAAVVSGRLTGQRLRHQRMQKRRAAHTRAAKRPAPPTAVPPSAAATTRIPTRPPREAPTAVLSRPAGSPRIFRGDDSATQQIQIPEASKPQIYRPPRDST
jgi:hypothetical protein